MHTNFIRVLCVICLVGCKKQEPVIDNPMLLGGVEGRLWLLYLSESEKPRYLWFDQYGQCQVLEFGIADEPTLVIPEENYPSDTDSLDISVLLNGFPYRMLQTDDGWTYSGDMEEEEEDFILPFTSDEEYARYLEFHRKHKVLTRIFIPDRENVRWYQKWTAQYYPRGEKTWWFLTKSFISLENHRLNGHWKNLSDSTILLNEQPYLMAERKVQMEDEWDGLMLVSDRMLILYHAETGDSIQLLDANYPPSPRMNEYWRHNREKYAHHKQLQKKYKKRIKSSILLNGKKSRLFRYIDPDNMLNWRVDYIYFDDNGIYMRYHLVKGLSYMATDNYYWNTPIFWYQKGNTIVVGAYADEPAYTILEVSASGDTIRLRDEEYNEEFLYIDTKLPPARRRK
jgi:hypothetical protein